MTPVERQREADAAQFEDWSPWAGLVYLMVEWGVIELRPVSGRGSDRAAHIPGIARSRRHTHISVDQRPWHLPLEHWRALRAALPDIKALDDAYTAERRAEDARLDSEGEARHAALTRITALAKPAGERTLGERIEVIAAAYLMRDRRLTAWERQFAADTATRWHRFGDRTRLTEPQRAVIERIHNKVSGVAVL